VLPNSIPSDPATRQPERPRPSQRIETPQFNALPDSGRRVVTPPLTYRSEVRRQERGAPDLSQPPRYNQPGSANTPQAPRNYAPAYQPPQNPSPPPVRSEPVRIQPAQPSRSPSYTPSPAPARPQPAPSYSAPSSPSRSQPSPPSSPSKSEGNRK